jgi:hypothetical protein
MVDPETKASELDPVMRAVAEQRAKEVGQSLSEYLSELILQSSRPDTIEGAADFLTDPGVLAETVSARANVGWQHRAAYYNFSRQAQGGRWPHLLSDTTHRLTMELSVSHTLHLVTVFNVRIHYAAVLMSAAFHEAAVTDFEFHKLRHGARESQKLRHSWYRHVVDDCLIVSKEVRNALVHHWQPTPRAERLATDAFVILSDLTPARTELLRLCRYDRPRAFTELAKHVDLAIDQFRLSADLLAEVEAASAQIETSDEQRFIAISEALLERAGGGISLTEGAKLLGVSRQALHKRVKSGSALGMMQGDELTLPRFQFITEQGDTRIVDGLAKIVALFDTSGAGRWSALQFLLDRDPNLADTPGRVLVEGRVDDVVASARAYLDTGED